MTAAKGLGECHSPFIATFVRSILIRRFSTSPMKELTLIHKSPSGANKGVIERIEQITTILAAVAIPVIIAIYGSRVQQQIAQSNADQEYVKFAVTLLGEKVDLQTP